MKFLFLALAALLSFNSFASSQRILTADIVEGYKRPAKNYIKNGHAEKNTIGWSTYADAAGNRPVDATGGTATNLTFSRTTSSPLSGAGSFSLVQTGSSNIQGKGVSYPFTIDSADKAKVLAITFDYNADEDLEASNGTTAPLTDGTTTTTAGNSDIQVFIYDVTNSALIPVSPQVITAKGTNNFSFYGSFQTAYNSTSYRLVLHVSMASVDPDGWTFIYDNVFVGPEPYVVGTKISDWKNDLTFTASAGFGTVTGKDIWYRQVGDSMQVRGTWITGTVAASTASIGFPSGFTIDYTKLKAAQVNLIGYGNNIRNSGTPGGDLTTLQIFADASTNNAVFPSYQTASNTFLKFNGDALFASNGGFSFNFTVPITGWAGTVQASNDSDTRVVAARYEMNSSNANNSFADEGVEIADYNVKIYDTHGAVTTGAAWKFTAPVSGIYSVSVFTTWSSSANINNTVIYVYKNGSLHSRIGRGVSTVTQSSGATELNLVAGDYIDIRPVVDTSDSSARVPETGSTNFNVVTVSRVSGPATIAANESVYATAYKNASNHTSSGSFQTVATWSSEAFDSHDAFNSTTGLFTCPISGVYEVNANILFEANATGVRSGAAIKNSTIQFYGSQVLGSSSSDTGSSINGLVKCVAGDTVGIQGFQNSGGNLNYSSGAAGQTNFHIHRVGN